MNAAKIPQMINNHFTATQTKNQARVAFESGLAELIPQLRRLLIQVMYSMWVKIMSPMDIDDGNFAHGYIADNDAGAPEFLAFHAKGEAHQIEKVGRELRKLFAWLRQTDTESLLSSC